MNLVYVLLTGGLIGAVRYPTAKGEIESLCVLAICLAVATALFLPTSW